MTVTAPTAIRRGGEEIRSHRRRIALAAINAAPGEDALKTMNPDVPVVFSMSCLVVLAVATGVMRQLYPSASPWGFHKLRLTAISRLNSALAVHGMTLETI